MVRIIKKVLQDDDINYMELAGLSTTDDKPSNCCTGSLFLEVDTGDVYAYDEAGGEWNKIASLGGGA